MTKQLSLFDDAIKRASTHSSLWKLYIDGASRSNPGPSGAGIYAIKDDQSVFKKGFFLGKKTNNQAEYLALILGLFYVRKKVEPRDKVLVISDSELLIRQLNNIYKVKNPELKLLYDKACELAQGIAVTFKHVPRSENTIADELANKGIDKKVLVSQEFLKLCNVYEL